MRMEKFEKEFVQRTGVRIIVGKGGMKQNTEEACRKYGARIVSSQLAVLLLQRQRSKRLRRLTGRSLVCLSPCGPAK